MVDSAALLRIFEEHGFSVFTGVPDSMFDSLIGELLSRDSSKYLPAVREDIAVGIAAGAYLAGGRAVVFMENSGLGVCLDALTSLVMVYRIPLLLLVAWAGWEGNDVAHHNIMGLATCRLLDAIDMPYMIVSADQQEANSSLVDLLGQLESNQRPHAVLIRPGVLS